MGRLFLTRYQTFLEGKTLLKQNKLLQNLFPKFKPPMIQLGILNFQNVEEFFEQNGYARM